MAEVIVQKIRIEEEYVDDNRAKEHIKGLADYYVDTWENAKDVVTKDFTDGFKLIGDDIVRQFKSVGDGIKGTAKDAVVDSVSAAFRGEMDSVEDIWGDSWDKMVGSVDGMFDTLFDSRPGYLTFLAVCNSAVATAPASSF